MLKTLAARSRLARSAVVRRIAHHSSGRVAASAFPLAVRSAAIRTSEIVVTPSIRLFSSSPSSSSDNATAVDDENRFLEMAEETLEQVVEWIDGIDEMLDDSDVTLSAELFECLQQEICNATEICICN